MPKKRNEISADDKWNIEAIFPTDELWEAEYNALKNDIKKVTTFKKHLHESAKTIFDLMELHIALERRLDKLYIYAHMRHDEESKNETYKNSYERAYSLSIEFSELTSWITPEILKIDDKIMFNYINSKELALYKFYFQKILRVKQHILSENEEKILSMAANALSTPGEAFRALNDADIKFGEITDSKNNKLELTHAQYNIYLNHKDRTVRENAFKQYHNKFDEFPMTFTALLQGNLKVHLFYSKARNYKNTLEAALFNKNIETTVYTNLIDTVKNRIESLHHYIAYRKKQMNLDALHLYDMYIPFVDAPEIKIEYAEAVDLLLEAVTPLGDEYKTVLTSGLKKEGWVDKYENENKRSGAYSTGSYDTIPYILLNYTNTLNSARTLAHEAGHSMHSYFSHKFQPPVYGDYPIFLAEVASTFNEELFNHYLLKQTKDKKRITYLINSRIEEMRATLFRQVMFAEFELMVHNLVEKNIPLTYQLLKSEYRKLNEFYFGKDVVIDDEIEIEWARIPHFYYNYYVYQYATGISAAIALFKKVINGTPKDSENYLNFLKSGSSKYPLETLKCAGVDMTTAKPINEAIDYFDELLKELIKLEK